MKQSLQPEVSSRVDIALIKLGPIYSCYFYAPPIPIYCIPMVKSNDKERVFLAARSGTWAVVLKLEI